MAQRFRVPGHDRQSLLGIEFGAYEAESMADAVTKLETAGSVVNEIAAADQQGQGFAMRGEPRPEFGSRPPVGREESGYRHADELHTNAPTPSAVTLRIAPEAHWPAIKLIALGIADGMLIMMLVGQIWTFVILGLFQSAFPGKPGFTGLNGPASPPAFFQSRYSSGASVTLIMGLLTMGLILLGAYLWNRRE